MSRRALDAAFVALAAAYLAVFAWRQAPGLFDLHVLEWDAREVPLPAWRFHATGLFPRDLGVDLMSVYATPLWKAVYWLGTLVTDPLTLSKWLPFVGLAIVAWQAFALGRRAGGAAVGATCAIVLVHCSMIWNRMAGASARGFAYPLVVAFLRYASEGAERRVLAVLALEVIGYPSTFIFCAPAWGLVLASGRAWRSLLRLCALGAIGAVVMAAAMWRTDPRIGRPPTRAQAASLTQMQSGSAQPYYPLPPARRSIADGAVIAFRVYGDLVRGPLARLNERTDGAAAFFCAAAVFALAFARRGREALPPIFPALAVSSLAAFALAWLLAYRLYLPDRMLIYGWPPLLLLGLPLATISAVSPKTDDRKRFTACAAALALVFAFGGDGLPRAENLTWFGAHDTPAVRFARTTRKDALFATHPERASYVECYGLRSTLFSSTTNVPFYYDYAREMERRIGDFYRAYYARDLDAVRAFARSYGVDYVIADERDFGADAIDRASYYAPWGALTRSLLDGVDARTLALAHPPPGAVVFRDGTRFVLDVSRL